MKGKHQKRNTVQNTPMNPDIKFQVTEAYKAARTNLAFTVLKQGCKKIVFTSSISREGKSTSAVNIAISLSQQINVKVLLIDSDLRKPKINSFFNLENVPGLTNYLGNMCGLTDVIQSTEIPNLSVICGGVIVPNPSELLASEAMENLLHTSENDYDYIILDTSPINIVIDALTLVRITDGVVIVVKEGFSTHRELAKTIETLGRVNAKILGIILNGTKIESKDNSTYHYECYE